MTTIHAANNSQLSSSEIRGKFITVSFFLMILLVLSVGCSNDLPKEYSIAQVRDGMVRIPLREVNDGKVHFYTYKDEGHHINFFVRTDDAGRMTACFDACFTCYKFGKGYRMEGKDLVCNECGLRFRSGDEEWDRSSGCSPIELRSATDKEYFMIKTADLEKGSRLFRK